MTNVVIDTKAQSTMVAHVILAVYMGSMVAVGYAIAANETVRMIRVLYCLVVSVVNSYGHGCVDL